MLFVEVRKNAKIRNHLTQDTTWERDKKHYIQESQEFSPFSAGDHKAAMNYKTAWQTRNISNKKDPQKKHRLWTRSVNYVLLEGLSKFHGTILTLIYDVDQDN